MNLQQSLQQLFELDEIQAQKATALFEPISLRKGEFLMHTSSKTAKLTYLHQGLIRIYCVNEGIEITQWIAQPGSFLTDLGAWIFQQPIRWNMQAISPCMVYEIGTQAYVKLQSEVPQWSQREKQFLGHCFVNLENRIYSHLALSAAQRYQLYYQQHAALFNQVPLHYIASLLGMTPETLSRIRAQLKA